MQSHRAWSAPLGAGLHGSAFLSLRMHFGLFSFHLITLMIAAAFPDAFKIHFLSQTTPGMAGNVKTAAERGPGRCTCEARLTDSLCLLG